MIKTQSAHSVSLSYQDFTARVETPNREDIQWLREFLLPHFEADKRDQAQCEIILQENDDFFRTFAQDSGRGHIQVDGFILDKKIVTLRLLESTADVDVYHDAEFNLFYEVAKDRTRTRIIYHSTASVAYRTALMRVIREYTLQYLRQADACFIHASSFSFSDHGVLIAGAKNAGKTSSLIYFLQTLPATYVSNDRVFLRPDGERLTICGIPTVLTVSADSLRFFPKLGRRLSRYNYHHPYTIREIIERGCPVYPLEKGEFTLTPAQFGRLLGIQSTAACRLSLILFPRIGEKEEPVIMRRLPPQEMAQRMSEARLGAKFGTARSIFSLNGKPAAGSGTPDAFDTAVNLLAEKVPGYDCHIGPDSLQGNRWATAFKKIIQGPGRET